MKLLSTYIESENFEKTVEFYRIIFKQEPKVYCENRWVEFEDENKLAIFNGKYDMEQLENNKNILNNYNEEYIKNIQEKIGNRMNNIITLNFYTENLKEEYAKIKKLNIGKISEIMYVNIVEPYYYFNIIDPEGNVLEICSDKY